MRKRGLIVLHLRSPRAARNARGAARAAHRRAATRCSSSRCSIPRSCTFDFATASRFLDRRNGSRSLPRSRARARRIPRRLDAHLAAVRAHLPAARHQPSTNCSTASAAGTRALRFPESPHRPRQNRHPPPPAELTAGTMSSSPRSSSSARSPSSGRSSFTSSAGRRGKSRRSAR